MRKNIGSSLSLFLLLAALAAAFFIIKNYEKNTNNSPTQNPDPALDLSQFSYTHHDGKAIRLSQLKDKIWVADFIFSSCPGPCNFMTAKMRTLQREFQTNPHMQFVSITVDPETDTPQKLRAYAERFQSITPQWLFLTGPITQTLTLAKELFKVPADKDPDLHSTHFILVDVGGRVHGTFNSDDNDFQLRIKGSIDQLLARQSIN